MTSMYQQITSFSLLLHFSVFTPIMFIKTDISSLPLFCPGKQPQILFLHLLFVLQICYFLILIFNLPVKEKSTQSAVQSTIPVSPSAGQLDWGRVEPSSTITSFAEGHQHQTHPQALPSTVNSAKRMLCFAHYC